MEQGLPSIIAFLFIAGLPVIAWLDRVPYFFCFQMRDVPRIAPAILLSAVSPRKDLTVDVMVGSLIAV